VQFLIYGAYGYTGQLICDLAKAEGLNFTVAGRNQQKVDEFAERLSVKGVSFDLSDKETLDSLLESHDAVIHCAGPFSATSRPMVEACLRTGTHYVDITGEIEVFEMLAKYDSEAKRKAISILPGAGFDVVPTDCMAAFLKSKLPSATHLEMGFASRSSFSRGTALTMAESMHKGGAVRENGIVKAVPNAYRTREIDVDGKKKAFVSIPWGDVSTAYYSTGIPNITLYYGAHPKSIKRLKKMNAIKWIFKFGFVQRKIRKNILQKVTGPSEEVRETARTFIWGEVKDDEGKIVRAEMRTLEGYNLTARSVVKVMQKMNEKPLETGFLTPSRAFGMDYIMEFPDTERKLV
jgi:short subunit dehydrogenase-like uncharacterized protein